jgi:hypothetical protein
MSTRDNQKTKDVFPHYLTTPDQTLALTFQSAEFMIGVVK